MLPETVGLHLSDDIIDEAVNVPPEVMEEVEKIKTLEKQMGDLMSTVYGTYKLIGSWGSGGSKCPPCKQAGANVKKRGLIAGGQLQAKVKGRRIKRAVRKVTDKLVQLDRRIFSEQNSAHTQEVRRLQGQRNQMQQEIRALRRNLATANNEFNSAKRKFRLEKIDMRRGILKQSSQISATTAALEKKRVAVEEKREKIDELQKKIARLKKEGSKAEKALTEAQQDLADLEEDYRRANNALAVVRNKLAALTEVVNELREELRQQEMEDGKIAGWFQPFQEAQETLVTASDSYDDFEEVFENANVVYSEYEGDDEEERRSLLLARQEAYQNYKTARAAKKNAVDTVTRAGEKVLALIGTLVATDEDDEEQGDDVDMS